MNLRRRWRLNSLRWRLVFIICVIISVILFGQALLGLSGEVAELDSHVSDKATILAQSFAAAAEGILDGRAHERFEPLVDRLRRSVDLVEAAIVDRQGRVLFHTDRGELGRVRSLPLATAFGFSQPARGIGDIFSDDVVYQASAPILRGPRVLGYVHLRFRSPEVGERAIFIVVATAGWAMLWLLIGATSATVYVRHITEPLATLTENAEALAEDRLDEVTLLPPEGDDELATLQRAFAHLTDGLRSERAENARLLETVRALNQRLQQRVVEVSEDLQHAHRHLEAVLGALEQGVVSCTSDGEIVQINAGTLQQLAGFGRPESGASVCDLVPEGAALLEAVREVVETGTKGRLELTRELPGAGARRFVFQLYPLRGKERTPQGVVITVQDETEQRRMETQLRRNDRLISLGTIAAGLAHELGNHMHIINGFSTMLLGALAPDSPHREDVRAIYEENEAAVELLRRFLQFARPGGGALQRVPVDDVVRRSLEVCGLELRKQGVRLEERLGLPGVEIDCEGQLLQQVLINLVFNAIDAMEGRPEKRLTVASQTTPRGCVAVEVTDTGIGIPEALQDRVFDPFFTTKDAKGTGLGLSIAHQIVDGHGGRLTVRSDVGVGTTFTVALPRPETREAS